MYRSPRHPTRLVFAAAIWLAAAAATPARAEPAALPGYLAVNAGYHAQPQWERVRHGLVPRPGKVSPWKPLIDSSRDLPPLRQLYAVNEYFNRIPYMEDPQNYGVRDYWADPREFVARNAGDCKDYALAKYAALRELGWPRSSLMIMVIRDHRAAVDHAALAVRHGGRWHLLDNRADRLLTWADVPWYQPIYGVNELRLSVFVRAPEILVARARPDSPKDPASAASRVSAARGADGG
jgi:predicted transglutaminase-like cysteine proteinase